MVEIAGVPSHIESAKVEPKDKPKKKRRGLRLASVVAAGAVALTAPHPVDSFRAARAFFGASVDCTGDIATSEREPDILAIPGATSRVVSGQIVPNPEGQRRITAAVERLTSKRSTVSYVALLVGQPRNVNPDSNERAYVEFFRDSYRDKTGVELDSSRIVTEKVSLNTAENMKQLRRIMNDKGAKRAEIITGDSHVGRAVILACAQGVPAYGVSAEQTIFHKKPDRKINIKEKAEQFEAIFDPTGFLPTLMRKISANG